MLKFHFGERLKFIRKKLLLSRKDVFEKYRIPEITLRTWENSQHTIAKHSFEKWINAFKNENIILDEKWILMGVGLEPKFKKDIVNYFTMDKKNYFGLDSFLEPLEIVNFIEKKCKNAIHTFIKDDSMLPFYSKGDFIVGILKQNISIENYANSNCIVKLENFPEYLVRKLKFSKNEIYLTATNYDSCESNLIIKNPKIEFLSNIALIIKKEKDLYEQDI